MIFGTKYCGEGQTSSYVKWWVPLLFTKDDIKVFYLVKYKIALEIAKQIDAEYKFYNSVSSEKD